MGIINQHSALRSCTDILRLELWVVILGYTSQSREDVHRLARSICRSLRDIFYYIPRPPRYISPPTSDHPFNLDVDILEDAHIVTWRRRLNYYPICECCGRRGMKGSETWPIAANVGRYRFQSLCYICEIKIRRAVHRHDPLLCSFKHLDKERRPPWWDEYTDEVRHLILWERTEAE